MGGYAELRKKEQEESSGGGGYSLAGLLGNAAGGFKDIVGGLGSLVGSVAHDVGQALWTDAPFNDGDIDPKDYRIFQLAKAAPGAIKEDFSDRYGPLWPGGRPAGETVNELYEDPLAFLGDIATVATLGGAGAARGAQAAGRIGKVGEDLAVLGKAAEVGDAASVVGRVARTVDRILPGAKFNAAGVTTPSGEAFPLAGLETIMNQKTGRVSEIAQEFNPARRPFQNLRNRVRTESIDSLDQEAGLIDSVLEAGEAKNPTQLAARRGELDNLLTAARETGTSRMYTPRASAKLTGKASAKIFNESGARFISDRTEAIDNYDRILEPAVRAHGETTVFEKFLGLNPHEGPRRLPFDDITRTFADPVSDPRVGQIQDAVRPLMEHLDSVADPVAADKTRRLVEIIAGEPLAAMRAGHVDDMADAMDNTRVVNMAQEAKALIETGHAPEDIFDHLYASRRVQVAHELGLPLDDAPDALTLDDITLEKGLKAPVYYPQPSNLTRSTSDYLQKKKIRGAVTSATPSSARKWGGRNLDAYLKGTVDALETNPVEAYSRLAAEWTGYRSTLKLMDDLKREFGMQFADRASVPEGWMVINPKFNRLLLRKNLDVRDQITRILADGTDEQQAFLDAVKSVFAGDRVERELRELVDSSGEVFAVPEIVAKEFDKAGKYSFADTVPMRLYYDPAMNAWRKQALYLRPGFYINNVIGNSVFMKLQGSSLTRMLRQLDKGYSEKLKNVLDELGVRSDVESGFYDTPNQRQTHLGKAAETTTGQVYQRLGETKVARGGQRFFKGAQRLSGIFEDGARREAFLTAAERDLAKRAVLKWHSKFAKTDRKLNTIMKYGIDNPRAAERWVDEMNDVMNNYRNLGPFERKIVRRFVAPFWPFYKHAAKTLLKMPFAHPGKARSLALLNEVTQDIDTLGPRPEWLESATPFGLGDQPGETRFLGTRGINPFAGITESPLSLLSPVLQMGLEQTTGRDSFTGRPFSAEGVYTDPFTGEQFGLDENGNPQKLERRLGGLLAPVAPTALETLLGFAGPAQTIRNITSPGARYSATGEVIEDEYGQPRYPTDALQELLKFVGVPTTDYNLGEYQKRLAESEARARGALGP